MEDEQEGNGVPIPPAARRFLERHRPAQDALGGANRGTDEGNDEGDGSDDGAKEPREADGEAEVDEPEISGEPNADDGVPAVPVPHPAPRPRAKGVSHPPVATRAQIERHALEQHVNYAPWCPHCVQSSALMRRHTPVSGESPSMPTISADFCFMKGRDADPGDGIPVLVMRDSQTRSLFSHACAGKSTAREGYSSYLIERCVEDIDSIQKDVHLKTDQEPAMIAFQARIRQARKDKTIPTNSPVGDHQANGRAEKGVQAFQNMARRMKSALESHIGSRLPHRHPVLMWLIEWVGGAHNRFKDGRDDGRTPRERSGWQSLSTVMEFGEVVAFMPVRSEARMDKLDAKLREGVWLGLDGRTDENLIGTSYGIYRSSTVRGLPEDRRWNASTVMQVVGTPWEPTPNVDADDAARVPNPDAGEADVVPRDPEIPEAVARRMYIRKADIVKFGETPGCVGCRCVMTGKTLQSHSPACRERIEARLRETDEGLARLQRADDRVTETLVRESERLMRAASRDDAERTSRQGKAPSAVRESDGSP